jgi:diphosphomevalonate decarboxylase
VVWGVPEDRFEVDGLPAEGEAARRIATFLDLVAPDRPPCQVVSQNNFPRAAGLASSASAFAALALAATRAAQIHRTPTELSRLARQGSGSACRSVWGGWVVWEAGTCRKGTDSHGIPLAGKHHWDLSVVVAMVHKGEKPTGSRTGMLHTQRTSPLYDGWVQSAPDDLEAARQAVLDRDLQRLGETMEHSTLKMHATMLSTAPSLRYVKARTLEVIEAIEGLRTQGVGAWYTMDAGPNIKVLCQRSDASTVSARLKEVISHVEVLGIGGDARVIE